MEMVIVLNKDLHKRIKTAEKGKEGIRHIITLTPLEKGKYTACVESQQALDETSWKIVCDKLYVTGEIKNC